MIGPNHRYSLAISLTVRCLLISFALSVTSCFLFRQEKKVEVVDPALLKAEIPMSEDYVRSKPGDLLAFIPNGWLVIDAETKVSADVVAVAVNQEYSLTMVVQTLRSSDVVRQSFSRDGLIGLAHAAFEKRLRKTANGVRLLSPVEKLEFGSKKFGYYEFTSDVSDTTALRSRSVVLLSSSDNYYEVSLVPTTITTAKIPDEADIRKIFHSIIVSLQF